MFSIFNNRKNNNRIDDEDKDRDVNVAFKVKTSSKAQNKPTTVCVTEHTDHKPNATSKLSIIDNTNNVDLENLNSVPIQTIFKVNVI